MYQSLTNKDIFARKEHQCDWCGQKIEKGEKYNYQTFIFDGKFCNWYSHLPCSRVVDAIWDYCDPDEGMGSDEFCQGCADVCRDFICPDCENWNGEFRDCEIDETYCIDKMDDFFKTHELYPEKRKGWYRIWKCKEKAKEDES